jgi:hypothetical protein
LGTDIENLRLPDLSNWIGQPLLLKKMKNNYLIIITFCFIVSVVSCGKGEDTAIFPTNRTVIVYMAADNDLSEDARDNLGEIQNGYEEKGTNLIVFIDLADDVPQILKIKRGGSQISGV